MVLAGLLPAWGWAGRFGRRKAAPGYAGAAGGAVFLGWLLSACEGLTVAGADCVDASLDAALAHSKSGGDVSDGVTGCELLHDDFVGVGGDGLADGLGGDGCGLGALRDRLGGDAGGNINHGLGLVLVGDDLAACVGVAALRAADAVRCLGARGKHEIGQGARLLSLLVAVHGGKDAAISVRCDGLGVVLGNDPIGVHVPALRLGAVLHGPRHADQGGIFLLAGHGVPLAAGRLGRSGGAVRLFQADGKLGAAAGLGVLGDGLAVQAPRLRHDGGFLHGIDLLYIVKILMGSGRFTVRPVKVSGCSQAAANSPAHACRIAPLSVTTVHHPPQFAARRHRISG